MTSRYSHSTWRPARREGAAVVEFAFLLPVMLGLVMATIEFGRAMQVDEALTEGARAGCRQAIALSPGDTSNDLSTITTAVQNACKMEGLPSPSTTADSNGVQTLVIETAGPGPTTGSTTNWSSWSPTWSTYSSSSPPGSGYLVRVTVKAQASQVTWLPMGGWWLGKNFYFSSNAVMRVP